MPEDLPQQPAPTSAVTADFGPPIQKVSGEVSQQPLPSHEVSVDFVFVRGVVVIDRAETA